MKQRRTAAEVELKLLVPPRAIPRLKRHPALGGGARERRLYSIYFDTPALDLWRRGIALRLRRDGSRWLQTVKGAGSVRAGLHRRLEIEAEVEGPRLDLRRLGRGALARALAPRALRGRLEPIFVTEFRRSRRTVKIDGDATVEAAIDSGEIRSGGRVAPISELELELKRGAPWQLYRLASRLARNVPLALGNRSKAERGYALYRGANPAPVKARPAPLARSTSVNEAFKAVLTASLSHLQANERGLLEGGDPEYLHQARVALRRMRSALSVFRPRLPAPELAPLAKELKWLAGALGPARDWDVFMTETLPLVTAESGERAPLAAFAKQCARRREKANRRARAALASRRYQKLALTLSGRLASGGWGRRLDEAGRAQRGAPVGKFARQVLGERYAQVRKRGRKLARLPAPELHRLRIAVKKFRYATDFFSGLFPGKATRRMLRRLSRLQDILGCMNDGATAAALMERGLRASPERERREVRRILLGWSRRRTEALQGELKDAWQEFRAAERFW